MTFISHIHYSAYYIVSQVNWSELFFRGFPVEMLFTFLLSPCMEHVFPTYPFWINHHNKLRYTVQIMQLSINAVLCILHLLRLCCFYICLSNAERVWHACKVAPFCVRLMSHARTGSRPLCKQYLGLSLTGGEQKSRDVPASWTGGQTSAANSRQSANKVAGNTFCSELDCYYSQKMELKRVFKRTIPSLLCSWYFFC